MNTRTPGTEKIQERVGQCVWGGLKKHRASEYKAVLDQQSQTTTDGQAASAARESMGLATAGWAAAARDPSGGRPATLQATRLFFVLFATGRRGGRRRLTRKSGTET